MAFDFKSIKSLFVVEDPNAKGTKKATPAKGKSKSPSDPQKAIVKESKAGKPGQVTSKFTDILVNALEKNNLPGVDYLEYRQSLISLEKMPMEEKVRYQSAFAMAQAMGATPQKLVDSASHYIDVLKGEEAKFEQALAKQESSKIQGRKQQIDQLNAAIQQKAEQIKKLTQEMEKHHAQMEQLQKGIQEDTARMETTKNNFIASYNKLVAQILQDVERMKKYLK
ncbi:MAG: hypothetical protein AAFZ15_17900 [Bacteroidota bacterium]